MKRTPLTRKTPLKAKTSLKPGGRLKARSTTRRRMGKPDPRWRSRKYLDWVKTQPSCVSGKPADDPHHIKRPGFGGTSKCSDLFAIPLTREEHDELHHIGWRAWEEKYQICQTDIALKVIELAIKQGVLNVSAQ